MAAGRLFLFACLVACTAASAVTPLQKVLEMLQGMKAKGLEAKHQEEVEFAAYHEWCDQTVAETTRNIDNADSQITQLTADIDKAKADAEELSGEVAELDAAVGEMQTEAKKAKAVRSKEHADFTTQHQDYSESIDACAKAIQVLKARSADIPQSLMQLRSSPLLPPHVSAALESFLALGEVSGVGAPEANAYEFQSGSVISILEKLVAKFKEQRLALEKAEMNAKANYQLLLQQLTDNIGRDESVASKKTSAKAGRLSDAANANGDLVVTERAKAEDEKTLSETNAECSARKAEYENNQKVRADELDAIDKAVEILSSGAVTGHAETHLPSFAQARSRAGVALAQVRGSEETDPARRARAVAHLQNSAKALGSRYLAVVAARAAEDPFGKVKKMIKDLIVKLMESANEEADHHAYCSTELATNKQTRDIKSAATDELKAQVDQLTAATAQLAAEITQLSDAIKEIKGQQAEATKMRFAEKKTNAQTVADAKEAQTAVEQAISILRDFYGHDEASLLQKAKREKEPYKGMHGDSTGVFGMLEVVLSDFARLESETSSAEDTAASAHQRFMDESTQDAAVKATELEHKEGKKQRNEEALRSTKKELKMTQDELDAALDYHEKLKADCVDTGLSYEDRVKMRAEEIQSLKEALEILDQQ